MASDLYTYEARSLGNINDQHPLGTKVYAPSPGVMDAREQEWETVPLQGRDGHIAPAPSSPLNSTLHREHQGNEAYPIDLVASAVEEVPFIRPPPNSFSDSQSATRVQTPTPTPEPVSTAKKRPGIRSEWWEALGSGKEALAAPKPTRKVNSLWKIWSLEILGILLGFISLIVIIVVLAKFDQHSLPDWPLGITLNTFLAFFTTLAKAAFMVPVSVAISRAQWTWFLRERPLYDFHIIDQASRGPWGSLVLLWRVRFRHFVALGALLTVVSVVTSPVSQLAISYPVRNVIAVGEQAYTPAINSITSQDRLELGTRKAILIATSSDGSNFTDPILPTGAFCPTGNCTFDAYQTLGLCVKMANITSLLRVEFIDVDDLDETTYDDHGASPYYQQLGSVVWNVSLPGGFFEMLYPSPAVFTDMLNGNETVAFADDEALLQTRVSSFVLAYPFPAATTTYGTIRQTRWDYRALEILFHLCVQTYETTVHMGVEETRQVAELASPVGPVTGRFLDMNCTSLKGAAYGCHTKPSRGAEILTLQDPAVGPGEEDSTPREAFTADYGSMEAMAIEMKIRLGGFVMPQYDGAGLDASMAGMMISAGNFIQTLQQEVLYNAENLKNSTRLDNALTNIYQNAASSLSSMLRDGLAQKYTNGAYSVAGKAWTEASYVHVTWGWITFLIVELLLAAGFLAATVVGLGSGLENFGSNAEFEAAPLDIKDSSLATLTALSQECRMLLGDGLRPMRELAAISKGLLVRLEGGEIAPVERIEEVGQQRPEDGTIAWE